VGDEAGIVEAYHVSDGTSVAGWPYKGKYSVQSTPATGAVAGESRVFLGVGTSSSPKSGGYLALHQTGKAAWFVHPAGVMSSMAFGPIQTSADVVGMAMSNHQYAINAKTGTKLRGFPWFQADTNFSSPALADLNHDGHDEIIEGGDSTKGVAYGFQYQNGGHIRILRPTGQSGHAKPNQALVCQYNTTQVVQSSPAVGGFLKGGATGIIVGTGDYYKKASDNHKIIAIDTHCHRIWTKVLDGSSHPSPSIADVDGNGTLDVIASSNAGGVWALNGSNGSTIWSHKFPHSVQGSISTFQSPTGNFQYLVVPTSGGLFIVDGRNGAIVQSLLPTVQFRNAATVTADPNGTIGITVAGILAGHTTVQHFQVEGTHDVTTVQTYGSWPMFHHDPQLTGYAPFVAPKP
jgi:outer membrane protein assembly factor BamB